MAVRVDSTRYSTVVVCLIPGCGARVIAADKLAALRLARAHERAAHPGETAANRRLGSWLSTLRSR